MMGITVDLSGLRRTRWHEFGLRVLLGGLITVATGFIAHRYGPVLGGLFLAFPAIFPASATLVEKHEKEKKQRAHGSGTIRGRESAAMDAFGAALGSIGLMGFALVAWRLLTVCNPLVALVMATAAWLIVSGLLWRVRRTL
jgi:hypothetical protein